MQAATDRVQFEDAATFAINVANAPRASHALSTFAQRLTHVADHAETIHEKRCAVNSGIYVFRNFLCSNRPCSRTKTARSVFLWRRPSQQKSSRTQKRMM